MGQRQQQSLFRACSALALSDNNNNNNNNNDDDAATEMRQLSLDRLATDLTRALGHTQQQQRQLTAGSNRQEEGRTTVGAVCVIEWLRAHLLSLLFP
jgi:hypothetical protein